MSMMVRKATLVRKNRPRRGQSQRAPREGSGLAPRGHDKLTRTSGTRATFTASSSFRANIHDSGLTKTTYAASSPNTQTRLTEPKATEQRQTLSSQNHKARKSSFRDSPARDIELHTLTCINEGNVCEKPLDRYNARVKAGDELDCSAYYDAQGERQSPARRGSAIRRSVDHENPSAEQRRLFLSPDQNDGFQIPSITFSRRYSTKTTDLKAFTRKDSSGRLLAVDGSETDQASQISKPDFSLSGSKTTLAGSRNALTGSKTTLSGSKTSCAGIKEPSVIKESFSRDRDQQFRSSKRWDRSLISRESDEKLLEHAARTTGLLTTPVIKHVGSSLKESELTKPQSDLPFTRADLPQRHCSLPARPGQYKDGADHPSPVAELGGLAAGAATVFFAPLAVSTAGGGQAAAGALQQTRHLSFPHKYPPLDPHSRSHGLDYPLRRPDSEKAYRELAEREQIHRSLLAKFCTGRDARDTQPSGRCSPFHFWETRPNGYQQGGGEQQGPWRRSSEDNCERSEFIQQVLEANKDADNPVDFVGRVLEILSTTVVTTIFLFLMLAVPIIMIIVGVKYMNDCPLERRIPVYLLVGGCFLILKLMGMLWKNIQLRRYESMDEFYDSPDSEMAFTSRTFRMMDWILSAFLLAWHVVGAYWVISIWKPDDTPGLYTPSAYCESYVYMCAFVEIVTTGILIVLFLLLCAILGLCYRYTSIFEQ